MKNSDPEKKFHPMTVADIFRESIEIYRANALKLLGIVAPNSIVWLIIFSLNSQSNPVESPILPGMMVLTIVAVFIGVLLSLTTTAVGTIVISERFLERELTVGEAYQRVVGFLFPLIGSFTLVAIAIIVGSVLWIPGMIAYAWFSLTPPVVMMEGEGGIGALKRSRIIVKGEFTKAFLAVPLLTIAQMVVALILFTLPGLLGNFTILYALAILLAAILPLLIEGLKIVTTTLLYYDLRTRKEGYNLEMMADELEIDD